MISNKTINAMDVCVIIAAHQNLGRVSTTELSQRLQLHAALACTWLQTENLMKADSTPWNWKLVSTLQ